MEWQLPVVNGGLITGKAFVKSLGSKLVGVKGNFASKVEAAQRSSSSGLPAVSRLRDCQQGLRLRSQLQGIGPGSAQVPAPSS